MKHGVTCRTKVESGVFECRNSDKPPDINHIFVLANYASQYD